MPAFTPKVTQCLISIEEIPTLPSPNNAVLLKTAVQKYLIGIRKGIGEYRTIDL